MGDQMQSETAEAVAEFKAFMADPANREAFLRLKAESASNGAHVRYSHVMRAIGEMIWATTPGHLQMIVDIVAMRMAGHRFTAEERQQRIEAARHSAPAVSGGAGVAVIPIYGTIIPKADSFDEISGGTSVGKIRSMFREAMGSPDVGGIVFDIDSPGGAVDQLPELAAEIKAARGAKPMVAVANTLAASGAYWLATQADEVVVTKSGRVGSVGVVTVHEDQSGKDASEGVKRTFISAGKFKTEGNPFEPLSDEGAAHVKSQIDAFYGMFVGDVARGRGVGIQTVRSGFGQGRVEIATKALDEGMVDRIDTLENTVTRMLRTISRGSSSEAAAGGTRMVMVTSEPDAEPVDVEAASVEELGGDVSLGTVTVELDVVAHAVADDDDYEKPVPVVPADLEPLDELEALKDALEHEDDEDPEPAPDPAEDSSAEQVEDEDDEPADELVAESSEPVALDVGDEDDEELSLSAQLASLSE